MTNVVCLVQASPDRVSFTWSQGPDSFHPYHLVGEQLAIFHEQIEEVRRCLHAVVSTYLAYLHAPQAGAVTGALAGASLALAEAGWELRKRLFMPSEGARDAQDVAGWLAQLGAGIDSLEVVTEGWLPLPWNLLYDRSPDGEEFLSGQGCEPWQPFWGLRYNLAGSQRVDVLRPTPLRRVPWPEKPRVLLVVDPDVFGNLPESQQRRLKSFADARALSFIGTKRVLKEELRKGRPDLLYWLGHATPEALYLSGEADCKVSPKDLTKMLEGDGKVERVGGLVFLNACRTAEASPTAGSFFKAVFGLKMSGLIATEQQTIDTFACPFGLDFLEAVLDRGEQVGPALQRLRGQVPQDLEHLPHRALLGVLYGTYCPPELRVVRPAPPPGAGDVPVTPLAGGGVLGSRILEGPRHLEPLPLPDKPYRSLYYYERGDRPLFAGRDDDVLRVARILDDEGTRLLVLHGESGCGKSSFLRAGLLPYLEDECVGYRCLHDRSRGEPRFIRATGDLAGQLAQALCDFCVEPWAGKTPAGGTLRVDLQQLLSGVLGAPATPELLRTRLAGDPELLGRTLAELGRALPFRLVVVIDQAEELFTLNWRQEDQARRDQAFEMLRRTLAVRDGNFDLVVALRTEYYGRLVDRLRRGVGAAVGVREYLLTDLDEERLAEAILRPTTETPAPYAVEVPVEKYGIRYAAGVAEGIAREVVNHTRNHQDSVLPLAQVICTQLFDLAGGRDNKRIERADLARIGGVEGGMRKHVEGVVRRLFAAPADRRAFQRLLAGLYRKQPDGTLTTDLRPAADAAREWGGRMPFEAMVAAASEGEWRLLRVSIVRGEQGERPYLSLGHDALAKVAEEWQDGLERRKRVLKWAGGLAAVALLAALFGAVAFYASLEAKHANEEATRANGEAQRATEAEKDANKQAELARTNQETATTERKRAEENLRKVERLLYTGKLALAQSAFAENNELLAKQHLEACQWNLRGWEYRHLWARFDSKQILRGHIKSVTGVAFSPDGRRVLTGSSDATVRVWDAATGQELLCLKGHTGEVRSVAYSPDGERILTGGWDKTAKVWDARTGKELLCLQGPTECVAFSPDGRRILTGGEDGAAKVWEVAKDTDPCALPGHTGFVHSVAYSPDGKRILTGDTGGMAREWDAESGQGLLALKGHSGAVRSAAFSPDGRRLLTGGEDGTARLWDALTGKELRVLKAHGEGETSAAFCPDGERILTGGWDKTAKVWDAQTGQELLCLKGHTGAVTSLAHSPDGKRIFTGSSDATARAWDAATGQELLCLKGHTGAVTSVAYSPDGERLLTGSGDGTARLWDAQTGKELRTLTGHWDEVTSVAFSPDGRRILTGSRDRTTRAWDAESGQELFTLEGHWGSVKCVAFSPDGRRALTGSDDSTARISDADRGTPVRAFTSGNGRVTRVAFSPDGKRVFAWDALDRVLAWSMDDGKPVKPDDPPATRETVSARSPNGRYVVKPVANSVVVYDLFTPAPPESDPWPLPNAADRRRYHAEQVFLALKEKRSFAFAFHLSRWLAALKAQPDTKS